MTKHRTIFAPSKTHITNAAVEIKAISECVNSNAWRLVFAVMNDSSPSRRKVGDEETDELQQ